MLCPRWAPRRPAQPGDRVGQTAAQKIATDSIADVPEFVKERLRALLPGFARPVQPAAGPRGGAVAVLAKQRVAAGADRAFPAMAFDGSAVAAAPATTAYAAGSPFAQAGGAWINDAARTRHRRVAVPALALHADMKVRAQASLAAVGDAAQAFLEGIRQTLSDLGEAAGVPPFMELSKGFAASFVEQHGHAPLALPSQLLLPLANRAGQLLLPSWDLGEEPRRYLYGTRGVFGARPPGAEAVAGAAGFIGRYNAMARSVATLDQAKADGFVRLLARAAHFLHGARVYGGWLSSAFSRLRSPLADLTDNTGVVPWHNTRAPAVGAGVREAILTTMDLIRPPAAYDVSIAAGARMYAQRRMDATKDNLLALTGGAPMPVSRRLDDRLAVVGLRGGAAAAATGPEVDAATSANLGTMVRLTADPFTRDSLRRVAETVLGVMGEAQSRDAVQVYNILDMNIVPLNVNAAMRDMPLAPSFNYQTLYEQLVRDTLGVRGDAFAAVSEDQQKWTGIPLGALRNSQTKDVSGARAMALLATQPYARLTLEAYELAVGAMMRGYLDVDMGRPKYLSDQLFNKALLNEVYARRVLQPPGPRAERFPIRSWDEAFQAAAEWTLAQIAGATGVWGTPDVIAAGDGPAIIASIGRPTTYTGHVLAALSPQLRAAADSHMQGTPNIQPLVVSSTPRPATLRPTGTAPPEPPAP